MSYKFNRVAKLELENFKRVVEIFCLSIDFRSMLLDQKCFQYCYVLLVVFCCQYYHVWEHLGSCNVVVVDLLVMFLDRIVLLESIFDCCAGVSNIR